jgi:hypothetical protein
VHGAIAFSAGPVRHLPGMRLCDGAQSGPSRLCSARFSAARPFVEPTRVFRFSDAERVPLEGLSLRPLSDNQHPHKTAFRCGTRRIGLALRHVIAQDRAQLKGYSGRRRSGQCGDIRILGQARGRAPCVRRINPLAPQSRRCTFTRHLGRGRRLRSQHCVLLAIWRTENQEVNRCEASI